MNMNVKHKLRQRRIELGLNMDDAAKLAGLSVSEYYDIEAHDDEIVDFIPLLEVKNLCQAYSLDLLELFEIQCPFCEKNKIYLAEYKLPRNELIKNKRISIGLSKEELSDIVGFYEVVITNMEADKIFLEEWVIYHITELSKTLDIPLQILLGVKCSKCGR